MTPESSAYAGPSPARTGYAGPVTAAALSGLGILVAVWPLTAVLRPGSWSAGAAVVAASVILAGLAARLITRRRAAWLAIPAVPVAQIVVGAVVLTVFAARQSGTDDLWPTAQTWRVIGAAFTTATEEIRAGVAPLAATPALAVAIAVVVGMLALVLDLILVPLRGGLVAAVLVAAAGAVPPIVVRAGLDPVWFLALAGVILAFLHVRFAPPGYDSARDADPRVPVRSRGLTTIAAGAVAVIAALVVSPLLPLSAAGINAGGGSTRLSATLDLGQDLRRPTPITALTLISQDGTAPYLRIATLSSFDGKQWQPDRPATVPLSQGFSAVTAPAGVATHSTRTTIRTTGIAGSWLPVPYQATAVRGVGGTWTAVADNRTVLAANGDAADQNYTVDATVLVPTLAQIRAATATGAGVPASLRALPKDTPAVIAEDAATVTGGAESDYDKLIALQTWFRAGFRYSLQTPVDGGFDGTNVDAVAKFLTVREGYCVHFAGAFALMARSLGMPTRIVVGYLPGTATDRRSDDGRVVFEVGSDQLHSWPEVYFTGIGWVPFEPTATRGVPTAFADPTENGSGSGATPTADATPLPTSSAAAKDPNGADVPADGGAGSAAAARLNPAPVLWTIIAAVLVLLIPAAVRRVQSARRMSLARRGDAMAAWAELQSTLQDLGLPAPPSESPRARGARLIRDRDADADAVQLLVQAVEQVSYAPAGMAVAADLRPALTTIRAGLHRHAAGRDRIAAVLAPRSLLGSRLLAASTS